MSDLLLELFSEEIPARMQVKAASSMLDNVVKAIKDLGINYNQAQYFVTPRRVTLHIEGLPESLPAKTTERKGPKIDANPAAIEGFLRSTGMNIDELEIIDGYYTAKKQEAARPFDLELKAIIEQMLTSFTWPKSMRINADRTRWVRPLRNILCLFNDKILSVEFAGLKANNHSFGHRFMAPNKLEINSFADYQTKMRQAYVVLSSDERRKIILGQISKITDKIGLQAVLEQDLLDEVVGLVEYPNAMLGKIEQEFIAIPREVLVCAMKTHQRYFYLTDSTGKIAPYFLVVANVKHQNDELIIAGNEKVLRARLSDAQFFWQHDLKQPSSERLAKLAKLIFHHKLGTIFDKTNHIIINAEYISNKIGGFELNHVKKAALLCKTDLVSEMVGEFPELQGIMGQYYALHSKEEPNVALAIAEHYRPVDTNDIGDTSRLGAVIAIADKLDSIVGLWLAGEKPTSSKDPFALRRAALGIIKLVRYHKFDLSLTDMINVAEQNYELKLDNAQKEEIISFFNDRLKYYLKAADFRHDLISAVLKFDSDNINDAIIKLEELQQFVAKPESAEGLFALKRVYKILSDVKSTANLTVDRSLLKPVELKLYDEVLTKDATLTEICSLAKNINQFFDEVLINDADKKLRENRLNLLYNITNLSNKIADFSLVEV